MVHEVPVSASRFPRYVSALASSLVLLVVVALPLTYFSVGHGAQATANQIKAEVKAHAIDLLVTGAPDIWRFEEHRLREVMSRQAPELTDEQALILDARGKLIVQAGADPLPPLMSRSAPLYDADQVVGRVEIRQSVRPLLVRTGLVALVGMVLAGGVFVLLRALPRRARLLVDQMHAEKERALVTLHSIGDGVITTDADQVIDYLNPVAERLTGWTLEEARGQPLAAVMQLVDEATQAPAPNPMSLALRDNAIHSFTGDVELVRRDGGTVAIEDSAAPIHDRQGRLIGGVMVFHDVTMARTMARRISWAASHDALTGLVNRREFETRVDVALSSALNAGHSHVLCYLDLDQFKVINDTCGHAAGDGLLKLMVGLLQDKLRASDTLARLGGDEFGVLLDSCPLERAGLIAADMLAAVQDFRFQWEGKVFSVGVSIGLVEITAQSGSRAEVFSAAARWAGPAASTWRWNRTASCCITSPTCPWRWKRARPDMSRSCCA